MSDFDNDKPDTSEIDVGYTGTRANAIASGDLIDAGTVAHEIGFRWHVALTKAVWNECVAWSPEDSESQNPQSQEQRLWELLHQCSFTIKATQARSDRLNFVVYRTPRDGVSISPSAVSLQVVAHYDEERKPVLTIVLPLADADA